MPRYAWNKSPQQSKRRYFELIREGLSGSKASAMVGVSLSCGSLWFIDAGSVSYVESPISSRYFNQDDRIEIADGLARKEPVKSIAERIGKSFQSVYKEIARNRKPDGRYQPWFAHNQAYQRRRRPKVRVFARDDALRLLVADKLSQRWSPAQISRWLRRRYPRNAAWHVCVETIYEAVYRGLVLAATGGSLRTGRTYRRRRGRGRSKDGSLKQSTKMTPIAQRPAHVESRRQVGHIEGDLIIGAGQRSAIATLVERKTRLTILVGIHGGHTAQSVGDALIDRFTRMPVALRRSLTWDQGNEMFHHERIASATGLKIYFADPHSPWQRGTNENTNGLLRQYFPKGTDLNHWTQDQLDEIANELNDRPRLCLNDLTPNQAVRRWWNQDRYPEIRHD
ncbi:IS30 family transposase [Rhodococcus sp. NPDC057297]|uniref:IS30 family transposase n=1 Tax=Rhodococcus sp. NPDC057297 TaxID=3346090 RepID=UPI00363272C3